MLNENSNCFNIPKAQRFITSVQKRNSNLLKRIKATNYEAESRASQKIALRKSGRGM